MVQAVPGHQAIRRPNVVYFESNQEPEHKKLVRETLLRERIPAQNLQHRHSSIPHREIKSFEDFVERQSTGFIDSVAAQIESVSADSNAKVGVINISQGQSRAKMYRDLFLHVRDNWSSLSSEPQPSEQQIAADVVKFVDETLDHSEGFNQAVNRYREATRQAAERGIVVVTTAGNDREVMQDLFALRIPHRGDAAYNFLAMSDHVISVGATNDQGTPKKLQDDRAAEFSSPGSLRYPVTLSANGVNVHGRKQASGTSFAAPQVSATVRQLLIANPGLTYQQVLEILRETAYDNPNIEELYEGAGTLQPQKALERARQMGTSQAQQR